MRQPKSRPTIALVLVIAAAALAPGCGSAGGPMPGPQTKVQAIFDANCVPCHNADAQASLGATRYPLLPLTAGHARAALLGEPAHEACGGTLVVAGDPEASYLHHKLVDSSPCEGVRMPAGGEAIRSQPLDAADIAAIDAWISAGAPD